MMKLQTNSNWDSLQNNGPVIFKSINVIKVKEKLKNCPRLKMTKETWQVNAALDSQLPSFSIKVLIGTIVKLEYSLRIS